MESPNTGYLPDGSRRAPLRTVPYPPRRCKTNQRDNDDIPVTAMAHLSLGGRRRHRLLALTPLPTWEQIKKLSGEGQKILQRTGKTLTAENLFLAMCALLTVTSSAERANVSYWAYIPNPPLMEPVMWGSMDITLYTTPSALSPPWNNLTYLNKDDGSNFNFTYFGFLKPICMGVFPCLQLDWQHWLLPGNMSNGSRMSLQWLSAWSINMTWTSITFEDPLLLPEFPGFTYIGLKYQPFVWQECRGKFGKLYQDMIMWGPYGQFLQNCSEWNDIQCDVSFTIRIPMKEQWNEIISGNRLMEWGDCGIADPPIASL
ncbi:endogenous retrovirus group K member 25 Env polyprotein-like [Onychomys torridus]|uniref:endogenous retrovirus group K member 25 Env polyprotein-like n=1 Tax=Onychomys torridus TaxID=38674 RepID=UPI00167F68B3|nr:endogenous retrovirus group K member 25 Env polyprotein-like [Onychomys torridus]